MTDEIIKAIAAAEESAAKMKAEAEENAAKVLQGAAENVALKEKTSAEVCKGYRETQIKRAHQEADAAYAREMQKTRENAKEYCANVLKKAEVAAAEIAGRIIGGDC